MLKKKFIEQMKSQKEEKKKQEKQMKKEEQECYMVFLKRGQGKES